MNIGIPKERRPSEFRVGLSPSGVEILCRSGHTVFVEKGAGLGAGFNDLDYEHAGARIVYSAEEAFGRADLLLKFARPQDEELEMIRDESTLAGFLLLASARQSKIDALMKKKVTTIAYEQIRQPDGSFPVMSPLSRICGSMTALIAGRLLQANSGGKGILLGGIPGVPPAEVGIIGAGVVGSASARAFIGLGAHVTLLDVNLEALNRISDQCLHLVTMTATPHNIQKVCGYVDVLIGAVHVSGERSPMVVTREMVRAMKPRSVIIDTSIDQGGCCETSRPTTHEQSTYLEEGILHYCVPNIPSLVARTATHAFVNAVMPYIGELVDKGIERAIETNAAIKDAVNTHAGKLHHLYRLTGTK